MSVTAIDKVKIIVVGDSGVGKTTLTNLICQNKAINNPQWTVGASVEVKLHEFKEGTPQQKTYFLEFWDLGGSNSHKNTRSLFYNQINGIILIHDLTNRKSLLNLHKWLGEILFKEGNSKISTPAFDGFDPEQFVGTTQIPILVIGSKLDLVQKVRSHNQKKISNIAEECGADEIYLDCRQMKSLAAGSSSSVKLSRFFDKVIEQRYSNTREHSSPFTDRRRIIGSPLSPLSPKYIYKDN